MKKSKNNTIKNFIYQLSSVLILIAACSYIFNPLVARYIMILGVIGFTVTTFMTPYRGNSLRGKRLFNILIFGNIFMIVGTCLMYQQMNEWVISMLIAGVLICYSSIFLSKVYKDEQSNSKHKIDK